MESDAYLLGTHEIELNRLQLQDRLWQKQTQALWERASIAPGASVLELGCGPGFSTMGLAQRVGSSGRILGWDRSAHYLAHLQVQAAANETPWVETHQGDVTPDPPVELHEQFDALYSRWLLCWMERPADALELAWKALRPGGRIALFDYFHYDALELFPVDPAFRFGIEAVQQAWRDSRGDPSIGLHLPSLLQQIGFEITDSELVTRHATPRDPLWQWPMSFFPEFMPTLVDSGHLTPAASDAFLAAFQRSEEHPQGHFLTPPMLSIVATKPR
ncbi:MAG: methyltransferase domain-containing protein [Planctomycetota bacterium]